MSLISFSCIDIVTFASMVFGWWLTARCFYLLWDCGCNSNRQDIILELTMFRNWESGPDWEHTCLKLKCQWKSVKDLHSLFWGGHDHWGEYNMHMRVLFSLKSFFMRKLHNHGNSCIVLHAISAELIWVHLMSFGIPPASQNHNQRRSWVRVQRESLKFLSLAGAVNNNCMYNASFTQPSSLACKNQLYDDSPSSIADDDSVCRAGDLYMYGLDGCYGNAL